MELSFTGLLVSAGFGAGLLSTVCGMGGGMLLVLGLSLLRGPLAALALTAPALLLGNVHRVALFRRDVDWRVAGVFVLGAFPGALVGGLLTAFVPARLIGWLMLAVTLLAAARGLGWLTWRPGGRALAPAGLLAGGVAAAAGSGVLVSPLLLAAGLKGRAFIATASATAVSIHVARLLGYGAGGLLDLGTLGQSGLVAVGILLGNVAGRRVRDRLGDRVAHRLTYGVLGLTVVMALIGVA